MDSNGRLIRTEGNGRNVNIDNYRVFIRVAKIGNLTAAAEQLGYTQSGISHIVAALEQEFGFPLLLRSKTGVTLTQEGERMLQTLREVVNRDDMLRQIAAEIKGVRTGRVRVGAFSSVAVCWLPKIITDFNAEYPQIFIDVSVGTYKTIEDMIISEEVDCGFMSGTMRKELTFVPLCIDRMLALVPPNALPPHGAALPLGAIADMDFIIPGEGSNYDIGRILRTAGVRPRVKYSVSDDYAAVAMAEGGLGMTIVPELILKGIGGEHAAVELEPACTRTIGVAARSNGAGSPACAAFMRFTESWVRAHSAHAVK